jgi:hypothetical protein
MGSQGGSVRLFESEWIERLLRVHPLVPALLWVPVIAWLLGRSLGAGGMAAGTVAWLAAGGLAAWTLTEYVVHRFLSMPQTCPNVRLGCRGAGGRVRTKRTA